MLSSKGSSGRKKSQPAADLSHLQTVELDSETDQRKLTVFGIKTDKRTQKRFQKEQENLKKLWTGKNPPMSNPNELRIWFRQVEDIWNYQIPVKRRYCSTTPLRNLKRISITDVRMNIPTTGTYLLLRCLENPKQPMGIITIVEDHTGNVFMFAAYNMIDSQSGENAYDVFPIGTTFILKEPLVMPGHSGKFMIHCDSPSDIVFLKRYHYNYGILEGIVWKNNISDEVPDIPDDISALKQLGNVAFGLGKSRLALEYYLLSIHFCFGQNESMQNVLFLNIAAAYLKLSCFEDTLKFTEKVLQKDSLNPKALYRAGRAHYEMRQFKEASSCFSNLLIVQPDNAEGILHLSKSLERLRELQGNIDLRTYYLKSFESPNELFDCADFMGGLEITEMANGERKIVATQDIKPGTLLLITKAICTSPRFKECNLNSEENRKLTELYYMSMLEEVSLKIQKNPRTFGRKIYDLPIYDSFLGSINPDLYCDEETLEEPIVDVERIKRILDKSALMNENHITGSFKDGKSTPERNFFLFPSYLKPSCLANAYPTVLNNLFILHAVRNIKTGEEITSFFLMGLEASTKVKEFLFDITERKCECRSCELDRKDGEEINKSRQSLSKNIKAILREMEAENAAVLDEAYLESAIKMVQKIEDSYRRCGRTELQLGLMIPYHSLARIQTMKNRSSPKIIKYLLKSISASGFDPTKLAEFGKGREFVAVPPNAIFSPQTLSPLRLLVNICNFQGKVREARKWLKVLVVVENVFSGMDTEIFAMKYAGVIDDISQLLSE